MHGPASEWKRGRLLSGTRAGIVAGGIAAGRGTDERGTRG
jgi:hypothetical protein